MPSFLMRAYHNDPAVKAKFVGRMKAHVDADELIRCTYWEDGKGCAVGCTIHSSNHHAYETELGWPEWLAYLEDRIFEGMSRAASRQFPLRLLEAVPTGFSGWDNLHHDFCAFLLRKFCKFDRTQYPDLANIVDTVIRLHEKRAEPGDSAWMGVRSAAESTIHSIRLASGPTRKTVTQLAAHLTATLAQDSTIHPAWPTAPLMIQPLDMSYSVTWATALARLTTGMAVESDQYDCIADWLIDYFEASGVAT